tara:strand:- start:152 stop:493 length:342 start_codon:yes stop_codon:yes gene_type:complete
MSKQERIEAAKERLYNRYPDRDEQEVKRMESFKGLTKEQLKENYEKASNLRDRLVKLEMQRFSISSGCESWDWHVVDTESYREPVAGFLSQEMAIDFAEKLNEENVDVLGLVR